MKEQFLIGIDPDVAKSGVAIQSGKNIGLFNYTFFQLFDFLKFHSEFENKPTVYIECGFLNKSNWHRKAAANAAFNAKIGEHTGANFEIAKLIVEMCEYLDLPHVKIKPTRTKIKAIPFKEMTGITQRTNQELRDAYMLIFGR